MDAAAEAEAGVVAGADTDGPAAEALAMEDVGAADEVGLDRGVGARAGVRAAGVVMTTLARD